eukprot:CAMPEP_0180472184 /NCGR_PEP_ID=MMETSP1036_2-20121128/29509_1 /TAXON_ID=632150 /ORGANISM="Azadinium spinosum, Strain 3D9" /LENGTH=355 /DNA_ID=CAMNT_0022479419 /DNA_START=101 /DNA_END=1168 /DNA_ORIENTATION=+
MARGSTPASGATLTGMVKSYNRKGFGFIMCQTLDQDIYFSRESVHPLLQTSDLAGENVTFDLHRFSDGKLQGRNLRPLGDVSDFRGDRSSSYYGAKGKGKTYGSAVGGGSLTSTGTGRTFEEEDRSRDWNCSACGERNFVKRFDCFKCHRPRSQTDDTPVTGPGPRRTISPHAGSRAMRDMLAARMARGVSRSRSRRKKRSRSKSSDTSSSSRSKKGKSGKKKNRSRSRSDKSKKRKKKKSRSRSSSHRSASSISSDSDGQAANAARASAAASKDTEGDGEEKEVKDSPEIEKAKAEALEKLMKLRDVEPKETRMKDWRALLRQWHPDKNPDRVEVATAVFQFLQKGKLLLDVSK